MDREVKEGLINLKNLVFLLIVSAFLFVFGFFKAGVFKCFVFLCKQVVLSSEKEEAIEVIKLPREKIASNLHQDSGVKLTPPKTDSSGSLGTLLQPILKKKQSLSKPKLKKATKPKRNHQFILLGPDDAGETKSTEAEEKKSSFVMHGPAPNDMTINIPKKTKKSLPSPLKSHAALAKRIFRKKSSSQPIVVKPIPKNTSPPEPIVVIPEVPKAVAPKSEPTPEPIAAVPEVPKVVAPKSEPAPEPIAAVPEVPKAVAPKSEPAPEPIATVPEVPKAVAPKSEAAPEPIVAVPEVPKVVAPKSEPAPEPIATVPEVPKAAVPKSEPVPEPIVAIPEPPKVVVPKSEPAPEPIAAVPEVPKAVVPKSEPAPEPVVAIPLFIPEPPKTITPKSEPTPEPIVAVPAATPEPLQETAIPSPPRAEEPSSQEEIPSDPVEPMRIPEIPLAEVMKLMEVPKEPNPTDMMTLEAIHRFIIEAEISSHVKEVVQKKPIAQQKKEIVEEKESYNFWPKRMTIGHVWGHQDACCIPFATNFTSLDIFTAPDYRPGHFFPFLDLKGHRFDNNKYAANIGLGGRFVPTQHSDFCEILGFNIYYDYRQSCIGYYQQVGAGVEMLGRRWDFRANAYVPFGHKRHMQVCVFDDYDGDFLATRRDIESVSYSFNGEIGYLLINGKNFSFYLAAGPYFLARGQCCKSTPGIEGRIRPQYKDYFAVDLSARYDDLFGRIWQIEFLFTLPLYQISHKNLRPCGLRDWQIYQPVERFEVMPLTKRSCWETNF